MERTGEIVMQGMADLGLSVEEFAGMLCSSSACVSRWRKGKRPIPCSALANIAEILKRPELLEARLAECQVMAKLFELDREELLAAIMRMVNEKAA